MIPIEISEKKIVRINYFSLFQFSNLIQCPTFLCNLIRIKFNLSDSIRKIENLQWNWFWDRNQKIISFQQYQNYCKVLFQFLVYFSYNLIIFHLNFIVSFSLNDFHARSWKICSNFSPRKFITQAKIYLFNGSQSTKIDL